MKKILTYVLLFLTTSLFAQNSSIRGVVLDMQTGEPLPYANIIILKQGGGTVSNIEGYFVLNKKKLLPEDSLVFSYVGYNVLKIKVADVVSPLEVKLSHAIVGLQEIQVFSKELTPKDIIEKVKGNYEDNYPKTAVRQKVFFHKYENIPFDQSNQLEVLSSDFIGLDESLLAEIIDKIPNEFTEYQDAVLELYNYEGKQQLLPVQAISLEENDITELSKELENMLGDFINDIEKTKHNEEVYYKFKTGVFSTKMESSDKEDTLKSEQKKDSLHYAISTSLIREELSNIYEDYGRLNDENWEFISNPNKYKYELEEITILNDQLVYDIVFRPTNRGLFEGRMYVTTDTYAITQLDYAYAPGKDSETFQLLGFGHSMNDKKCRVIFDKVDKGYFIKYINIHQNESVSINRKFSIRKKKKRFLIDKELNEVKMDVNLKFEAGINYEVLVLERDEITQQEFDVVKEPETIKFKKKISYDSDIWGNSTVITPTIELQKYQRQSEVQ